MYSEDEINKAFLEELHDLAKFRLSYSLEHSAAELRWEDPDVKRVIEALAFFGARTYVASLSNMEAARHRLYRQFFPYLLSPIPATAMMQAKPTGHLTEELTLPEGTEFVANLGKGSRVVFRSARSLRVLPFRLDAVKLEPLTGMGVRILLSFEADYPLNNQLGTLSLHVNYLNDHLNSLKIMHFLEHSLKYAGIQFGVYDSDQACTACEFRMGVPPASDVMDEWHHPLEAERYFFHFPQQECYLELDVAMTPRNWKRFTVVLDCKNPWPRQLKLNRDIFQLFTVTLVNNQRAMAEPIICNGSQERHTIRHPKPEFAFSVQEVLGVYEVSEQGLIPLRPGILSGGDGSYEIQQGPSQPDGGHLYWLIPHFPSAFDKPRTLAIEALWQQPWYDQRLQSDYSLQAFHRQTQGVRWELVDTATPHAENRQLNNDSGFLHLLTLMHKPCLNCQDLRDLLLAFGSISSGRFRSVFDGLLDLRIEEEPLGGKDGRLSKQIYYLRFKPQMDESTELVETFVRHAGRMLDLWIADAMIEARRETLDEENSQ